MHTAVTLTVIDENKLVLNGVQVHYQVNGGEWVQYPEQVNGRVTLDGGVGSYHIRAEKAGYQPVQTTVPLAAFAESSCADAPVTAMLALPFAQCSTEPQPVLVQLPPIGAPHLQANAPNGSRRTLTCRQPGSEVCREYALPLLPDDEGDFSLQISKLPDTGVMQVTDGVVTYSYEPFEIALNQGMRQQLIAVEGITALNIALPVARDEVGCPLLDLTAVTHTAKPDSSADTVFIDQQGRLLMTNLSAPECQVMPALRDITYEVTLPAGTHLDDVAMVYWRDEAWQTAVCRLANSRYLCTAQLPSPLINQFYATRVRLGDQEYSGTQLPATGLCLVFGD